MPLDKIISDIKSLDSKIEKKEQEISDYRQKKEQELSILKAKRDRAKAEYLSDLLAENNLTIDDVQELLGGAGKKADAEADSRNIKVSAEVGSASIKEHTEVL